MGPPIELSGRVTHVSDFKDNPAYMVSYGILNHGVSTWVLYRVQNGEKELIEPFQRPRSVTEADLRIWLEGYIAKETATAIAHEFAVSRPELFQH